MSLAPDEDYYTQSPGLILQNERIRYRSHAARAAHNEDTTMGNEAPGSEQRRQDPNKQGTSTPGSQDPSKTGQMEQAGQPKQPGGSQQRQDDKEKDRSKSGDQRPD